LARFSSTHAPIALAFACFGALHAAALGLCLRPRPAGVPALAFVAAAALLSGSLARLGLLTVPLFARNGVETAALLVVAMSAFVGALGYGALLRSLLRYCLAPGPLVVIAFACGLAASAALVPMRQYPVGGTAWLAIFWWLAFSGGLCAATGWRACSARKPPDLKMPESHCCGGGTREYRRSS
jgi:hypothetical protein